MNLKDVFVTRKSGEIMIFSTANQNWFKVSKLKIPVLYIHFNSHMFVNDSIDNDDGNKHFVLTISHATTG